MNINSSPKRLLLNLGALSTAVGLSVATIAWARSGSPLVAQAGSTPPPPPPSAAPSMAPAAQEPPPASQTPSPKKKTHGNLGPVAPGTVIVPFNAGRTTWEGVSNGVTIRMTIDRPSPPSGTPFGVHMEATSPEKPCCGFSLVWGSGQVFEKQTGRECPGGGPSSPGTATADTTHTYNKPGRYNFLLTAITGNCSNEATYGTIRGTIDVLPGGAATSQGPSLPTIVTDRYGPTEHDGDPSYVSVFARARDEDGFIARFVIDYGDGHTETLRGDGMGCRPTSSGWPSASMAWTPHDPPPTHRYGGPGTYTITVTAYSTGCDGSQAQEVRGSFTHVWSKNPPQPQQEPQTSTHAP